MPGRSLAVRGLAVRSGIRVRLSDQCMKARLLALYLPQFHPIPENDLWWGKGFTEWTNVGKARRYFRNHYQPRVPADLGYYDLRVAETRQAQADMAREYGVEGFVYWHYWFGNGKRLLERPFNEVLASGEPDFPFALAWANESWRGFAHGITNRNMLIEQLYGGVEDYTAHFRAVLPAFRDHRYITVDGKPLFMIYKPLADPEVKVFIATWRELAEKNGLPGILLRRARERSGSERRGHFLYGGRRRESAAAGRVFQCKAFVFRTAAGKIRPLAEDSAQLSL